MDITIGLLIITLGSILQSSSYVPIKKVKNWSWESFWIVQGLFAWLIFPFIGTLLVLPDGYSFVTLFSSGNNTAYLSVFYGVLWGVGNLTFGLSMRYLGVALGQSIALGTCSAFGTIIPALMSGKNLFSGNGLVLLISVCVAIAGIAVIGFAGSLRSQNLTDEQKKAAIKDFAFGKGIFVAIMAGFMSACFSLGIEAGLPIKEELIGLGVNVFYAGLPTIFLITLGGFITNAIYCLFQNYKNKSFSDYYKNPSKVLINNLLFCTLAGGLWYSQFIGFEMGKSFFSTSVVMLAFSWSILLSLNIVFSNVWGVILKEWKGVSFKTAMVLMTGISILILSLILPNLL
jgi:L-rhamnose-H+ transport protein